MGNGEKGKRFDFLRADHRPELRRSELRRIVTVVLPVALCIAILTTFGVLQILISRSGEEQEMLRGYLEDAEQREYYDQALALIEQDEVERLEQRKLTELISGLEGLRALTPEAAEQIRSAASGNAEIRELSYDESEGTLTLLGAASTVESAARFSQGLRESGVFEQLDYSGYQVDGANRYEFTVTGTLKGGADGGAESGADGE